MYDAISIAKASVLMNDLREFHTTSLMILYFLPGEPAISHGRPAELHLWAEPDQLGGGAHPTEGGPHARRFQDQPTLHGVVDIPGRDNDDFIHFLLIKIYNLTG